MTFIKMLRDLIPELSEEAIYLRFSQLIGIYLYVLSDAHRIEEISGTCVMPPSEQVIEEIVAFASAG